ncbi:hypothetical protein [Phenylobacterium sp.]|uniref:hypothetical protein n=1 Tax=Phenylobacterium sp. TaxID=1871053 RepID=UPI0025D272E1|nr:hypothetical protein [Phenylobacterium sp.]
MLVYAVFAAALAAGAPDAGAETASPDAQRCAALTAESDKLRAQVGAARTKKTAGFLAGAASRALVYAPGLNLGDSRMAQYAAQEAETAVHNQAVSGLDKMRSGGQAADATAAKAKLKEIDAQAAQLSCPKA